MIDPRSQSVISTLLPAVQPYAVAALDAFNNPANNLINNGWSVKAISGTRSYKDQDALFNQGRHGNPGHIVTNAPGGYSLHNFGIAFDIGIFNQNGQYIDDIVRDTDPYYITLGPIGKSKGLEWGGDWQSIKDYPHYQYNPLHLSTSQLRERVSSGQSLF